ncbi:HNH endonuclease signature motif containing protein [Microbacterium sp. TNHR37B]|uniref:HNH endonuclease signature motif containing protein n=1 Tax=Microbacterium sp. TNHR37B TaxID=1775956 RepID=UPI0007B2606B|nr:HNH endonuclease signature motif containing protein [Microbacterium sp. TNHR37B]KZE88670.1 hypothetical protein AVP41_03177 [Microbacterium sp. TNHR37B]
MEVIASASPAPTEIDALLDEISETNRRLAALHAREIELLAAAVRTAERQSSGGSSSVDHDIHLRSMAAQIGIELRASDRSIQRRMSMAALVVSRFPAAHAALGSGQIDRAHVRVIVEAGMRIDDDEARASYEAAALDVARRESPGRLRPAARLLASRADPVDLGERHRAAAAQRGVWVRDLDDGMAELVASLPAPLAHGIHDRLTSLARSTMEDRVPVDDGSASPDHRGMGELRADAFADLLLTGHATLAATSASIVAADAITTHVQVTIPVLTLLGHDTTPAELAGHGPIDLATARALAATAEGWDRVLTHPVSGDVLAVDRYRPSAHLRRTLRARDEHCRFPGCRQPARRCDIDHTIAREHDGATDAGNLAHLCRRHHTLKHHSAWRVRQLPGGVLEWTSPTGRVHPDRPKRTLVFSPLSPLPPPPPPPTVTPADDAPF